MTNFALARHLDWLETSRAAVLALHSKREGTNEYMAPYTYEFCVECRQSWPCKTVQTLDEPRS